MRRGAAIDQHDAGPLVEDHRVRVAPSAARRRRPSARPLRSQIQVSSKKVCALSGPDGALGAAEQDDLPAGAVEGHRGPAARPEVRRSRPASSSSLRSCQVSDGHGPDRSAGMPPNISTRAGLRLRRATDGRAGRCRRCAATRCDRLASCRRRSPRWSRSTSWLHRRQRPLPCRCRRRRRRWSGRAGPASVTSSQRVPLQLQTLSRSPSAGSPALPISTTRRRSGS